MCVRKKECIENGYSEGLRNKKTKCWRSRRGILGKEILCGPICAVRVF